MLKKIKYDTVYYVVQIANTTQHVFLSHSYAIEDRSTEVQLKTFTISENLLWYL